jgi:hypothetical protein
MTARQISARGRRLACAPYYLYTHKNELEHIFRAARARGWAVTMVLPFTAPDTLERMRAQSKAMPDVDRIEDFTCRALMRADRDAFMARPMRAMALLLYFLRATWWLLRWRPDVILMTSDLGGVSVRFLQTVGARLGVLLVTLQTTLFMRVAERKDLVWQVRPAWLHRLQAMKIFVRLFLYFGEVPGSFRADSLVLVQNEEIRDVCVAFSKPPERVRIVGSLQSSLIAERRTALGPRLHAGIRVLFLTECIEERFGHERATEDLEMLKDLVGRLPPGSQLVVRFHPRESERFRAALRHRLGGVCEIDASPDPTLMIAWADVAVGSFSMLLFDAQSAGVPCVFIDVGIDPIGFYTARRQPLVADAPSLADAVIAQAAGSPRRASEDGGTAVTDWTERVVDILAGEPAT